MYDESVKYNIILPFISPHCFLFFFGQIHKTIAVSMWSAPIIYVVKVVVVRLLDTCSQSCAPCGRKHIVLFSPRVACEKLTTDTDVTVCDKLKINFFPFLRPGQLVTLYGLWLIWQQFYIFLILVLVPQFVRLFLWNRNYKGIVDEWWWYNV